MKNSIIALIAIACLVSVWTATDAQAFQIVTSEMMEKEIVTVKVVDINAHKY